MRFAVAPGRNVVDDIRRQWIDHGWSRAADGVAMAVELITAATQLEQRVNAVLRPFGLTMARLEVLMALEGASSGGLTVTELAAYMQVHSTSATHTIHRLVGQGLVRRRSDSADGRRVVVTLTPKGRELAVMAAERVNDRVFCALGLTPEHLDLIWKVLRGFRRSSGDF